MRLTQIAGRSIRVGCGSGFWGDSRLSTKQLVNHGDLGFDSNKFYTQLNFHC